MTQPTPDARAVVRALDALLAQVKRIADRTEQGTFALVPPPVVDTDDAPTTPATTCSAQHRAHEARPRECIRAGQHLGDHIDEIGFHWSDTVAMYPTDSTVRIGHVFPVPEQQSEEMQERARRVGNWIAEGTRDLSIPEQAPAADEETQRATRRERTSVLLARAERGVLSGGDADQLRRHVETEIREADYHQQLTAEQGQAVSQAHATREEQRRRAKTAETELRVLRAGLRANGADPTQIQNLWAQIRLRNRQWAEAKKEVRLTRNLLEEGEVDTDLIDEMIATVESAHGRELEALAETEKLRALLAAETARADAAIDRETAAEEAAEEQRAAIERVRTAMTWARHHHPGLRHVHERLAAALDGTEQPTTEGN